jgi:glyoxylase-like metal-dependent hydrolase (beta-lactamase superfamily II)
MSSLPWPTVRVRHGDRLEVGGKQWTYVHTPGHTVDHLCLYDRDAGVLLSGDHVLPSISPHVQGIPGGNDVLAAYLDALALVASLDGVRIGLPAHGEPIPDVAARVQSVERSHARRSERVLAATRALGSGTVLDIGRALFARHHRGFASDGEAYVHLEHLLALGEVERVPGRGPARYRARV